MNKVDRLRYILIAIILTAALSFGDTCPFQDCLVKNKMSLQLHFLGKTLQVLAVVGLYEVQLGWLLV